MQDRARQCFEVSNVLTRDALTVVTQIKSFYKNNMFYKQKNNVQTYNIEQIFMYIYQ